MRQIPFNAFTVQLMKYIIDNHPDRVDEQEFINQRGEVAANKFAECSRQGMTVDEAMHQANATLYRGLVFSPYHFVRNIILDELDNSAYTEEDTERFVMQMLQMTTPTIKAWMEREEDPDAFQGSASYPLAYNQIKNLITSYIVNNGLQ